MNTNYTHRVRNLAVALLFALSSCSRNIDINDFLKSTPTILPTASPTPEPTPTLEPTPTPLPISYFFLTQDQIQEFESLQQEHKDVINHLAYLQETYGYPLIGESLEASVALGLWLAQYTLDEQIILLESPLSPFQLDNAKVYNFGFFATATSRLALVEDAFDRLGFEVYTLDWTENPGELDENSTELNRLIQHRIQDYIERREDPEIIELGHLTTSKLIESMQAEFPEYTYRLDFPDAMRGIIKSHDPEQAFIGVYNVHMHLRENKLIISSFNDLAAISSIIPYDLLDVLNKPYIAIFDTCPENWPQRVEAYLVEYNNQRVQNGRDELHYLIIFGKPQNPLEEQDPHRLLSVRDMIEALHISIYQSEVQAYPFINYPITTILGWDTVLTDPISIVSEFIGLYPGEGNTHYTLSGAYIFDEEKEWLDQILQVHFYNESPFPHKDSFDNISIYSLNIITNIDPFVVENFLLADIK